jgi:hypothetical protein
MRPPKRDSSTFEKVVIGEFITGIIEKIEYDENHKFTYKGEEKISPAVRFVFKLEGYEYPHRSRWMNFNVGEKSNLYKKYITKLVNNAKPDMDFDLDAFVNMPIKTIWEENGDFQNLESIYPAGKKITVNDDYVPPPGATDDGSFAPEYEEDEILM